MMKQDLDALIEDKGTVAAVCELGPAPTVGIALTAVGATATAQAVCNPMTDASSDALLTKLVGTAAPVPANDAFTGTGRGIAVYDILNTSGISIGALR